jgi:hypothetical protein
MSKERWEGGGKTGHAVEGGGAKVQAMWEEEMRVKDDGLLQAVGGVKAFKKTFGRGWFYLTELRASATQNAACRRAVHSGRAAGKCCGHAESCFYVYIVAKVDSPSHAFHVEVFGNRGSSGFIFM